MICFFVIPAQAGIHTHWLFWCDHSLCAGTQVKATRNSWAHGVHPISDPAPPHSPGPTTPRVPSPGGWEGEWAGDARNSWAHGVDPIDAPTSPLWGGRKSELERDLSGGGLDKNVDAVVWLFCRAPTRKMDLTANFSTSPQGGGEREHGDPIATYSRVKERPPNAASPHKLGLYHLSGLLTRAARAAP